MNNEDALPLLSGAGGYWQVIDEVASWRVIQQQDRLSCGPACAEMLLKEKGITFEIRGRGQPIKWKQKNS